MSEQIITLPLSNIIEIPDIPDRELDKNHVASLVATNEPDKWPPIIVTPIGDKYGRIAGKHRIAAAKQLQRNYLQAVVRTYKSPVEMYAAMWEDNARNGLALTTRQRKDYAINLYQLQPSLSLRELGRRAGLPHQTVKAAIQELQDTTDEEDSQTEYNRSMTDYSKKLISSLNQFYENERALFGSVEGKRSEIARAKALASRMNATSSNVSLMQSLARTLNETANILAKKAQA